MELFCEFKNKFFSLLHNEIQNNSKYHLEGDVWTHTMMVYALCPEKFKHVALLHDIGKPFVRQHLKDKNRIVYRGHASVSTLLSIDFYLKGQISLRDLYIINYHDVLWERSQKHIEEYFSYDSDLLDDIREFSRYDSAGNIHTNTEKDREYSFNLKEKAFQPSKKEITMLVGLPGCGKSTFTEKLGIPILSRDAIVAEMCPGVSYADAWNKVDHARVNRIFQQRMKEMKQFDRFVIDMTNLSWKSRRKFFNYYQKYQFKIITFLVPFETILQRNRQRKGKQLSYSVCMEMAKRFQLPLLGEGNISRIEYMDQNSSLLEVRELNAADTLSQSCPLHPVQTGSFPSM